MTPTEELREAARLMRERATSCEQSPWTLESDDKGNAWINLPAYEHAWGMHGFPNEAQYVVSMHPAVALAVADLLEPLADFYDQRGTEPMPLPLAIARAYLSSAS